MNDIAYYNLMKFSFIGIGLFSLGLSHLTLHRRSVMFKSAVSVALIAGIAGAANVVSVLPADMLLIVAVLLASVLAASLWGSGIVTGLVTWLAQASQNRFTRFGGMAACGFGLLVYGIIQFDLSDKAQLDHEMAVFERIAWRPPLHVSEQDRAMTDLGGIVELNSPDIARSGEEIADIEQEILNQLQYSFALIRHQQPDETSNCHGWVFTGGKYWLGPEAVAKILVENDYQPVVVPHVNDIVIYRNAQGIIHTAIVRYTGDDVPIVEGKWGWMGVFLHPVDQSTYGTDYTYYRSHREGHLLVGLGGNQPKPSRFLPPLTDIERMPRNH